MGGDGQPYIYEASLQHTNRIAYPYSDFNPRAHTQASYASLQQEEEKRHSKKRDGPLINFNQHPDSYMIIAGQNVKYDPMPANTKKKVTTLRWIQFTVRLVQEIGALGLLVCVICLKQMQASLAWIMRIAPAWDALITLYAIYHLVRPAKARTATSSASYHFFALFMDTGLIPFYIFIAIFSRNNLAMPVDNQDRWTSFFTTTDATNLLLVVTFATAAAIAGLHAVSGCLDLWLIILFRKIGQLPPDMNPLEDNLTARPSRQSKHKHKNSEITLSSESMTEKASKYLSGSTLALNRHSYNSSKDLPIPDPSQIPFRHSRTGSDATFSPHNPETARVSRQRFEEAGTYQQSQSARSSRMEDNRHSRTDSAEPSKLASFAEVSLDTLPSPSHSPRQGTYTGSPKGPYLDRPSNGNPARFSSPALPNAAPSNAVMKSQQRESLLNDNWYLFDDSTSNRPTPSRKRTAVVATAPQTNLDRYNSFDPQPLKMNPPTPPMVQYPDPSDDDVFESQNQQARRAALATRRDKGNGGIRRSLTIESDATNSSSVYSESAPPLKSSPEKRSTPKGKAKYYGDLAAATMGVRGKGSNASLRAANSGYDATGMAGGLDYGFGVASPPSENAMENWTNVDEKGRVLSRTGADVVPNTPYPPNHSRGGFGIRGRRDVSGKVAEEGRGGSGWNNLY